MAAQACCGQHPERRIRYRESAAELAEDANALVMLAEGKEFRGLDLGAWLDGWLLWS